MATKEKISLPTKPKLTKEEMGARLKEVRQRKSFTQQELADYLGTTNIVISDYERGRLRLPADIAVQLAHALEVTTDELLGAEELEHPSASLFRRFKQIEAMPTQSQKVVLDTLDTFLRGLQK